VRDLPAVYVEEPESGRVRVQAPRFERVLLAPDAIERRLVEEAARAQRYGRALAVVVVELTRDRDDDAIVAATARALRSVDVVGRGGAREIVALLPETSAAAVIPARRLLEALGAERAGIATAPDDARDAGALLSAAREAVRDAPRGEVAGASAVAARIEVGGRAVVTADAQMRAVFDAVRRLATSDLSVLVSGETGAGKEVIAALLHELSPRRTERLVAINCAAIAESLLESELFGYERGAFSGAVASKPGLFEAAHGGTIFLDEIGECSPMIQAKLLRVLETKRVMRVGAVVEREVDVRVVCATNRDLAAQVRAGRFRQDLFYRLGAATVVVPPLRARALDVPLLARAFLEEARAKLGRPALVLSDAAMRKLEAHAWPGNVRELRNAMEYVAATADDGVVEERDLPVTIADAAPATLACEEEDSPPEGMSLYDEIRALERRRIAQALRACGGVRARAAERLGMPLRTLTTKLREHGLGRRDGRGRREG